jgi:4'-phosphopantetheinyl transferase
MKPKTLNISSTVSLEKIPYLWEQNDILILIININDYDIMSADHLDDIEKEHLESLQTGYFRKRYNVSRMVLKCILCILLKKQSTFDVSLYKDKYGRLHVHDHDELNICVSYTGDVFFLTISKIEVGIDAEKRKHTSLKNVSKYMQIKTSCDDRCATDLTFLTSWTLKEAYCKFSNQSIFSYLNKAPDIDDICHSSYLINNKYILTVVTGSVRYKINISFFEKIFYD